MLTGAVAKKKKKDCEDYCLFSFLNLIRAWQRVWIGQCLDPHLNRGPPVGDTVDTVGDKCWQ